MSSKPQLSGHLARTSRIGILGSIGVGLFFGVGYYVVVGMGRKRAYEEYAKSYDEDKEWKHLLSTNLLKTVDRNGTPRKSLFE